MLTDTTESQYGRRSAFVPADLAVTDRPLHTFSAGQQQVVVNYKALAAVYDTRLATMAYEVKRTRAFFDPKLGPSGGWRCPVGTRYGGQITDRFGRNCGWGVARRLANAVVDAGERVEGRLDKRRERRVARRNARVARRLGVSGYTLRGGSGPGAATRMEGLADRLDFGEGRQSRRPRRRGRSGPGAATRMEGLADRLDFGEGRQSRRPRRRGRSGPGAATRMEGLADRLDFGEGRESRRPRRRRDRTQAAASQAGNRPRTPEASEPAGTPPRPARRRRGPFVNIDELDTQQRKRLDDELAVEKQAVDDLWRKRLGGEPTAEKIDEYVRKREREGRSPAYLGMLRAARNDWNVLNGDGDVNELGPTRRKKVLDRAGLLEKRPARRRNARRVTPEPKPKTPTPEPKPKTPTPEPKPKTPTPEPKPKTPTPEPKPKTPTPEPKPKTPTPEPKPKTPTPEPKPKTPEGQSADKSPDLSIPLKDEEKWKERIEDRGIARVVGEQQNQNRGASGIEDNEDFIEALDEQEKEILADIQAHEAFKADSSEDEKIRQRRIRYLNDELSRLKRYQDRAQARPRDLSDKPSSSPEKQSASSAPPVNPAYVGRRARKREKIVGDIADPQGRPRRIRNSKITTEQQAVKHVADGGSLNEVPNEFWLAAIQQNSSRAEVDTTKRFRQLPQNGGAIGDTRIFALRDASGESVGQGWVLKGTPSFRKDHDNEVLGAYVAGQMGIPGAAAGWDGTEGGMVYAVTAFALNGAESGDVITPPNARGANYDVRMFDGLPDKGHPERLAHLLVNAMLATPDRHDQNGMTFLVDGKPHVYPIDLGWAFMNGAGVRPLAYAQWQFSMDHDFLDGARRHLARLDDEEALKQAKQLVEVYDRMLERGRKIAERDEAEFVDDMGINDMRSDPNIADRENAVRKFHQNFVLQMAEMQDGRQEFLEKMFGPVLLGRIANA